MKSNADNDATAGLAGEHAEQSIGAGLLDDVQSLWGELRGVAHDHLLLAALETRRAGESLALMLALGIMIGMLLNAVWMGLVVVAVQMLIEHGMGSGDAILLAVAANLLFTLSLYYALRRKSRYLQFPATLGSLQPVPQNHRKTG